jgi:DNA replication protein DnaC
MISRAQITAVAAGDAWLEKGANLLLFGPPGGGLVGIEACPSAHQP